MKQHTSGPWIVRNSNGAPTVWTADKVFKIAAVPPVGSGAEAIMRKDQRYGNAYLMAAAPEMLDALERASIALVQYEALLNKYGRIREEQEGVNWFGETFVSPNERAVTYPAGKETLDVVRAAISAAGNTTGEVSRRKRRSLYLPDTCPHCKHFGAIVNSLKIGVGWICLNCQEEGGHY